MVHMHTIHGSGARQIYEVLSFMSTLDERKRSAVGRPVLDANLNDFFLPPHLLLPVDCRQLARTQLAGMHYRSISLLSTSKLDLSGGFRLSWVYWYGYNVRVARVSYRGKFMTINYLAKLIHISQNSRKIVHALRQKTLGHFTFSISL